MKYFIFQGNDHDCGFASLKMLLAHLAKDKSYLYIPKPDKREKYSIEDIRDISSEYGVSLECFVCDESFYEEMKPLTLTLIDENHVILIKKKKKRRIIYYDPDKGRVKISKDEFFRRWRKIVLEKSNEEPPYKIKKIRQEILPKKLKFLEAFSALFSASVLIACFYLLNTEQNYIYSFLFLCLFVVLQLLEKLILYKQVYTFDKTYIPNYLRKEKSKLKQKYQEYIEFKRQYFTSNRTLISSILVAFLITFLLCFNDFKNVFVLLTMILIKLLETLLLQKYDENKKNQIAELEQLCFKDDGNNVDHALKANFMADNHILYTSFKDVFYIFVAFALSITMLFVTGNSGCNFVIFHFVLYYEGLNSYNQIISGLSNRKENAKLERRFFDSCKM